MWNNSRNTVQFNTQINSSTVAIDKSESGKSDFGCYRLYS